MDALILARMQFAAIITFHILFPVISIALAWVLMFFRWRYLRAVQPVERQAWLGAYRFWTKVFALTFALGVVSGITMSFQFGTNWASWSAPAMSPGRCWATRCSRRPRCVAGARPRRGGWRKAVFQSARRV